jgi:hypothetical protein
MVVRESTRRAPDRFQAKDAVSLGACDTGCDAKVRRQLAMVANVAN